MGNFSFRVIFKEEVLEEIKMLNTPKAIQVSDIAAKIIKENGVFF